MVDPKEKDAHKAEDKARKDQAKAQKKAEKARKDAEKAENRKREREEEKAGPNKKRTSSTHDPTYVPSQHASQSMYQQPNASSSQSQVLQTYQPPRNQSTHGHMGSQHPHPHPSGPSQQYHVEGSMSDNLRNYQSQVIPSAYRPPPQYHGYTTCAQGLHYQQPTGGSHGFAHHTTGSDSHTQATYTSSQHPQMPGSQPYSNQPGGWPMMNSGPDHSSKTGYHEQGMHNPQPRYNDPPLGAMLPPPASSGELGGHIHVPQQDPLLENQATDLDLIGEIKSYMCKCFHEAKTISAIRRHTQKCKVWKELSNADKEIHESDWKVECPECGDRILDLNYHKRSCKGPPTRVPVFTCICSPKKDFRSESSLENHQKRCIIFGQKKYGREQYADLRNAEDILAERKCQYCGKEYKDESAHKTRCNR